jgi:predicted metalloprotease with PDZ domain
MPQTTRFICPIEYTVSLHAPQTQTVEIRMLVRNIASQSFDVALPVWRTGRYAILNQAGTVSRVRAQNLQGKMLPLSKLDKTTWRVQAEGCSEIEIQYSVHANSLGDRTRHVDDTHAFLSGATVFLYVPDRRNEPLSVRIDAPTHWGVSCSLETLDGDPRTLLAPGYDVLIDSPIEIGIHDVLHFDVEGVPHQIVLWGAPALDSAKLIRDFEAIVRNEAKLFSGLPYTRYVFIVHVGPGLGGGTEHLNSTVIQAPPRAFEDDAAYKRLLVTASHEMLHVWNVKRLRPAALATTDFTRENYTDLLWFCEGTTAYYDELVLARANLTSADAYLNVLSELIQLVRRRPGSKVQSVAESSFDAWIKFNQPTSDDMNSTVSFYDSGAAVSFLLDLELRARTGNRVSLDTLMVEMVTRFPATGPGFTNEELIDVASSLAGSRFDDFFTRYIRSTEPLPLEERVGIVGLKLSVEPGGSRAYTGLISFDQNTQTVVRYVLSDGPAYMAGVLAGDEIVALNGHRYNAVDLSSHMEQQMNPGDRIQLELLRRGRQRTIEFAAGSAAKGRWRLSRIPSPSTSQRDAYATWLQQPWPDSGNSGTSPELI